MDEYQSKELISAWSAYVCPVPGGAMQTWAKFMTDEQDYNLVSDAIAAIAERSAQGVYKRNPNLGHLQNECNAMRSQRGREGKKYADCHHCLSSGLLHMVIAMDLKKTEQVPVPFQVAIPSDKADLSLTPCSCDRGIEVHGPEFITKGSIKSDEGRYYSRDQIIKLATSCGYTSRVEAETYRAKCERFYHAYVEKHGDNVDQTIGYKGEENKQVYGFIETPERRYDP